MNIRKMKKGVSICRTELSKNGDRSYTGDELVLVSICNGMIYYRSKESSDHMIFGAKRLHSLPLSDWSEGWEYYIDPLLEEDVLRENILGIVKKISVRISQLAKQEVEYLQEFRYAEAQTCRTKHLELRLIFAELQIALK